MKKVFGQLEAITKDVNNEKYDECVEDANKVMKTEPKIKAIVMQAKEKLCHCYSKVKYNYQ